MSTNSKSSADATRPAYSSRRDLLLVGAAIAGATVTGRALSETVPESLPTELPGQPVDDSTSTEFFNSIQALNDKKKINQNQNPVTKTDEHVETLKLEPSGDIATFFERLKERTGLPLDSKELAGAANSKLRIESGLANKPLRIDDFVYLHVEPLLDQAADLLDRAVRDRTAFEDFRARMFAQLLEMYEYRELDAIHQMEISAGVYEMPLRRSESEHAAETSNGQYQQHLKEVIQEMIDDYWVSGKMKEVVAAAELSGWLQGRAAFKTSGQGDPEYIKQKYDGDENYVHEHSQKAYKKQAHHALYSQAATIIRERELHEGGEVVSRERIAGLNAQKAWDQANVKFLNVRTVASRRIQNQKLQAALEPDGVLNYEKHLTALQERFQFDVTESVARMVQAQKGLETIYGYSDPLPDPADSINYFDNCLAWVRRAIQWLIRFSRNEQSYAYPLSLRKIMGEAGWAAGTKYREWHFRVSEKLFPDLAHVRLRGLSATVLPARGARSKLWRFSIELPTHSAFVHLDGTVHKADQSMLPACTLGRVTGREANRSPDIVGLGTSFNASPIGLWRVLLDGFVSTTSWNEKYSTGDLCDIQLDLQVAFRRTSTLTLDQSLTRTLREKVR